LARILWNKLGSAAEVQNSEIGTNFSIAGAPTYNACKFNNGVFINNGANRVSFVTVNVAYSFTEGCWDYWDKTTYNVVSGKSAGANKGINAWWENVNSYQHAINFNKNVNIVWVTVDRNGVKQWITAPAAVTFNAGDIVHFGWDWKFNHATKKRAIYFQGVEVVTDNTAWVDEDMTAGIFIVGLYVNYVVPHDGTIDDIVWWDTYKTDFSDRNIEGRVVSGAKKLIDGFDSPLVDGVML